MDPAQAAAVLGLDRMATSEQIRAAYRDRIRLHHPDLIGSHDTGEAARINEAYAVLRGSTDRVGGGPMPPASAAQPYEVYSPVAAEGPGHTDSHRQSTRPADVVMLVDDDTVAFSFPADEVFPLLVAVAEELGEISYVDADNAILEAIVAFAGQPACSVVLSLQGRADQVEAFCTIEALDGSEPPPVTEVVNLLVRSLRSRLRSR